MAKRVVKIEVGDSIEVSGVRFVCTELVQLYNDYPTVTFQSPEELIEIKDGTANG